MEHSPDSVERVQEIIRTAGVEFINLQFTDIMGIVKTVGIPVGAWPMCSSTACGSTARRSRVLPASPRAICC